MLLVLGTPERRPESVLRLRWLSLPSISRTDGIEHDTTELGEENGERSTERDCVTAGFTYDTRRSGSRILDTGNLKFWRSKTPLVLCCIIDHQELSMPESPLQSTCSLCNSRKARHSRTNPTFLHFMFPSLWRVCLAQCSLRLSI